MKKKVEKRTKETQIKMCTSLSFYCGKANNQSTRRPHKSWDLFLSPEMGGKNPPHTFVLTGQASLEEAKTSVCEIFDSQGQFV